MFCFQCEQTAQGQGCDKHGVCGKPPETAELMDVLVEQVKGISQYASRAHARGQRSKEIDVFVIQALFATVTNVDFDPARIEALIKQSTDIKGRAKKLYENSCRMQNAEPETLSGPAAFVPAGDIAGLRAQVKDVGIEARKARHGDDIAGVQELILYGVKGAAAYMDHAQILGQDDAEIYAQFHGILDFLADEPTDVDALLGRSLETGELNLKVMELLDKANTGTYGHPEPTEVNVNPVKGKAILVTGHDLLDLKMLLEQTEGKGVNIYTHGEMLPAHAYPELKKYTHLVGNFGGAWQDQQNEFEAFPGAILFTTNCLQKPRDSYKDRVFTTGLVGWPDLTHIEADARGNKDFSAVIDAAQGAPGFTEDEPKKTITIGFARNTVMSVADKVIDAVKAGKIKHFFLVGGCDGAKPGRNYYTDFARAVPDDCVILTLACGKYRFNKLDFGDIGGIPRLLDIGQCNDAYSAIQIAVALAGAFECGVNDLPLSMVLSWYEQKAVAILLTLLHLGVQNIHLGPSLPAFVTPTVLNILVNKFAIKPISEPKADLAACLTG